MGRLHESKAGRGVIFLLGTSVLMGLTYLRRSADIGDLEYNVPVHRRIKSWVYPDAAEQARLRPVLHDVETTLRSKVFGEVHLKAQAPSHFKRGHDRLPDAFYEGPIFFVSGWNPMGKKGNATYNEQANDDLFSLLGQLRPRPKEIIPA